MYTWIQKYHLNISLMGRSYQHLGVQTGSSGLWLSTCWSWTVIGTRVPGLLTRGWTRETRGLGRGAAGHGHAVQVPLPRRRVPRPPRPREVAAAGLYYSIRSLREVSLTALIVRLYSQRVPGPGQQPRHLPLSPGDLLGQAGPALVRQQAGEQ